MPAFEEPVQLTTQSALWGAAVTANGLELYATDWNNNQWDLRRITRSSVDEPWPDSIGESLTSLNSRVADDEISFTSDGLIAVYNRDSVLYQSSRVDLSADWSPPQSLSVSGWAPSISSDGLTIYYTNDMWSDSGADLFESTRASISDRFAPGRPVAGVNTTRYRESSPHISADGLSLYFVSDRPGGEGLEDIWLATRPFIGMPFGEPINLGPDINTSLTEWSPFTTPDGDLYYARNSVRNGCCWYIWQAVPIPQMRYPGDYNGDGTLGEHDLILLGQAIALESKDADLNQDGRYSWEDQTFWIKELKQTYLGDANLDGEFNSEDFVDVFAAGQYEDETVGNSTWSTGDWNGDGEFNSTDFVVAFADGGYEAGPRVAVAAVPEPSGLWLLTIGLYRFLCLHRKLRCQ